MITIRTSNLIRCSFFAIIQTNKTLLPADREEGLHMFSYLWYRVEVFVPAKMKFLHIADHANYNHAVTKAKCAADTAHKFDKNSYSIIEVMNYDEVKRREFYGRR